MRTLDASSLGELIESLCLEVTSALPDDVLAAVAAARDKERSERGRRALDLILENAAMAREQALPICQDTGIFSIYLSLAPDAVVQGDLTLAASQAVANATRRGGLRASIVSDPLGERRNTGDNTPPLLHLETAPAGEGSTLSVMAKGGGSEMASRLTMLPPGAGWPGVLAFVVRTVEAVGARSCPPLVLGVGVGGGFDTVSAMAKRALLRPLGLQSERESELAESVNRLGIGPGAVGGTVTCLGASIAEAPCHMASMPVAVSVSCHALRRKTVDI